MKWAIVIAICIAIFGFIPGMGMPCGLALLIGNLAIAPFYKLQFMDAQRMWPAALMATGIIPFFIPLAYFAGFRKTPKKKGFLRYLVFALVMFIGCLATCLLVELKVRAELAEPKEKKTIIDLNQYRRPFKLQR